MDSYIKSGDTWLHTAYMYTKVDGTWIMIFDSQKSNDSIAPGITISAPTSTSSTSPTYYGDSATYRVYGTATDSESGVYAVYVNDQIATIDGNSWYYDITLTENETTTVSIYAVDNAGNESPVYTRYVYYDTVDPALTVSAPTGTSSNSPTYYQSDSAISYTVSGTVSDTVGIQSVSVNGMAATISDGSWSVTLTSLATNTTHTITVIATDNSGRTTTVNRYLKIEAYYQYAARVAGATIQASLDDTLTNSSVCTTIAGNSTAYEIMKTNYSSTMTDYIDSNWNEGLNTLNYKCKLKTYIIKDKIGVSGFDATTNGRAISCNSNSGDNHIYAISSDIAIDLTGYTKGIVSGYRYARYSSGNTKIGFTGTSQSALSGSTAGSKYYNIWYLNNATYFISNADPGASFNDGSFALNASYNYLVIMMQIPTVNDIAMSGNAYITDLAITP